MDYHSLFDLTDVRKDRSGPGGTVQSVLSGVTLAIPATGVTCVTGPSDSGKTTLLRLLNRLEEPIAGTIRFKGEPLAALDPLALRRRVGMVLQTPVMLPGTVRENLQAGLIIRGRTLPDPAAWLERVGLRAALLDQPAAHLSGGEKQRFVGVVMLVSMWQKLGLERDLLIGTVRAAVQLVAVGYVLFWVFDLQSYLATAVMLSIMLWVAAANAAKKGKGLPGVHWYVLAAIGLSEVLTVGLMLALRIIPPTPQYLIPISGMVIGNSMVNASLLLNRLQGEMAARRSEVEVWLALGATPRQAAAKSVARHVRPGGSGRHH